MFLTVCLYSRSRCSDSSLPPFNPHPLTFLLSPITFYLELDPGVKKESMPD